MNKEITELKKGTKIKIVKMDKTDIRYRSRKYIEGKLFKVTNSGHVIFVNVQDSIEFNYGHHEINSSDNSPLVFYDYGAFVYKIIK